jgi:hypothetical protein
MRLLSKLRLSLAALLLILGSIVSYAKDSYENKYELQKKAIYFEIHTKLLKGNISLEEAQKMWQEKIKQLKKEEAK